MPYVAVQHIIERDQAHPDVMRHVGADHRLFAARVWPCVVDRVTKSKRPKRSLCFERREVAYCLMRLDLQSERTRIWSDNKIFAQSPLESEIGNAEPTIL